MEYFSLGFTHLHELIKHANSDRSVRLISIVQDASGGYQGVFQREHPRDLYAEARAPGSPYCSPLGKDPLPSYAFAIATLNGHEKDLIATGKVNSAIKSLRERENTGLVWAKSFGKRQRHGPPAS